MLVLVLVRNCHSRPSLASVPVLVWGMPKPARTRPPRLPLPPERARHVDALRDAFKKARSGRKLAAKPAPRADETGR